MLKIIYLLLPLLLTNHSYAAIIEYIPDEHPNDRYSVHNNGTVTDKITGLMWKVCSQGQDWNNNNTPNNLLDDNCTGTDSASTHTWQAALTQAASETFATYSDWRLPNIKQLASIVAYNSIDPSINESIFPNTPAVNFWSASPYAYNSSNAWLLVFDYGYDYNYIRTDSNRVRLVRVVE